MSKNLLLSLGCLFLSLVIILLSFFGEKEYITISYGKYKIETKPYLTNQYKVHKEINFPENIWSIDHNSIFYNNDNIHSFKLIYNDSNNAPNCDNFINTFFSDNNFTKTKINSVYDKEHLIYIECNDYYGLTLDFLNISNKNNKTKNTETINKELIYMTRSFDG